MGIFSTIRESVRRAPWQALRRFLAAAIFSCVILLPTQGRAQGVTSNENAIKAAFLYKFINYVQWPSGKLPSKQITLCVIGDDSFGDALRQVLHGKKVQGRTLVVNGSASVGSAGSCQILFIGASKRQQLDSILRKASNSSVLTVGEMNGFSDRGGMINFVSDRNKVRFEINNRAAGDRGLTISSQLLKLAKNVKQ